MAKKTAPVTKRKAPAKKAPGPEVQPDVKKTSAPTKIIPIPGIQVAEKDGRRIVIYPGFCKGCEICVRNCPSAVLEMKSYKAHVARIEECIECMMCELRCPDFAIEVHPSGRKGKAAK